MDSRILSQAKDAGQPDIIAAIEKQDHPLSAETLLFWWQRFDFAHHPEPVEGQG